jgi:hypothetical protein
MIVMCRLLPGLLAAPFEEQPGGASTLALEQECGGVEGRFLLAFHSPFHGPAL